MNPLKTLTAATLFGLVLAATPAFANDKKPTDPNDAAMQTQQDEEINTPSTTLDANVQASTFADLDLNADGFVTRDEVSTDTTLTQRFAAIDKDSDGKLSKDECSDADAKTGCYR